MIAITAWVAQNVPRTLTSNISLKMSGSISATDRRGPPTPGTGWAAGVERLAMMVNDVPVPVRPICVVPIGEEASDAALRVTHRLRRLGFTVELGYSGNVKKRLIRANKINSSAAILLGEDELAKGVATIRDMGTGEQTEAPLASLEEHLARYR